MASSLLTSMDQIPRQHSLSASARYDRTHKSFACQHHLAALLRTATDNQLPPHCTIVWLLLLLTRTVVVSVVRVQGFFTLQFLRKVRELFSPMIRDVGLTLVKLVQQQQPDLVCCTFSTIYAGVHIKEKFGMSMSRSHR